MILMLVTTTVFLVLLEIILVSLGMSSGNKHNLMEYRPNLGLSARSYETSASGYATFIIFAVLVAVVNIVLSIRVYAIRRRYAVIILSMGVLLIVLSIIVNNALVIRR